MSEHYATVTVNAPVHQVYELFTHFNDFPKFMHFVKEVTYYDDQRSHWVAQMFGTQQWDAVNEEWIPDQQIGWRSINGLENTGKVKFSPLSPQQTSVNVYIHYTPPAGVLGATVEHMGGDSRFDDALQNDLNNFARMVAQAPSGALDPVSSHYLFHDDSAASRGAMTQHQRASMESDPMMSTDALQQRNATMQQEVAAEQQVEQEQTTQAQQREQQLRQTEQEQRNALQQQAQVNRQEAQQRADVESQRKQQSYTPDPVYDTIGGRNASQQRTVLGDQDAQSERFPLHNEDPMIARNPNNDPHLTQTEVESPWRTSIQGKATESKRNGEQGE